MDLPAGTAADPALAADRLATRYGLKSWTRATPAWNETLDVLLGHRSVRRFLPDALSPGILETLVGAAQSAPSSSNLQVWSVVAVEDPERKSRLATLAVDQAFIRQAPLFLVWLIDHQKLRSVARTLGQKTEALDYVESLLLGAVDAALAAQNATVALESLGLGATYVGAIRNRPVQVAAELALPQHVFPLFGMAIGRPDPAAGAGVKPRLPQDAVLFREQYGSGAAQLAAIETYNPRLRAYQRAQGMTEQDWTVQATTRTAGPQSMAGRHRLQDFLQELGFPLL
ncbi:MAG: NADPH-dependent oxidoreductase [Sphingomonas sp.]|nr:NADPH-dependent oxidoreductase [Sphingomonas sp.]